MRSDRGSRDPEMHSILAGSADCPSIADLAGWAAENSDRIIVLGRAVNAAKKSEYQDAPTLYAALEVLASTYPAVKAGSKPRECLKDELLALGIEIGGSVDPGRAGQAGEEYFVRWRGRRRFLDQHLKKGANRDPRFTLRIYFTWDDDMEKVIVGWLPSHLSNSKS